MGLDHVYEDYEKLTQQAAGELAEYAKRFSIYLANQRPAVLDEVRKGDGHVAVAGPPHVTSSSGGLEFKWKFWDGESRYEAGNSDDMKLAGSFSWHPSMPRFVQISATHADRSVCELDDFLDEPLLEHMASLMSKSLRAQVAKKFPHLG